MYVNSSIRFAILYAGFSSSPSSSWSAGVPCLSPSTFFSGLSPGVSGGVTYTSLVDVPFPLIFTVALFGIRVLPNFSISSPSSTPVLILALKLMVTVLSARFASTFLSSTIALILIVSDSVSRSFTVAASVEIVAFISLPASSATFAPPFLPTSSSTLARVSSNSRTAQPVGTF